LVNSTNSGVPALLILMLGLSAAAASGAAPASNEAASGEQANSLSDAEDLARTLVAKLTPGEKVAQLLNVAPAIPRLGIPTYNWWTESLHGALGAVDTTNFPEPIALAATFDVATVHDVAAAIGQELRALHALARTTGHTGRIGTGLDTWSPNINIFRDPRWGRGQETYGEDPFLTASMGVAFVRGMQGPDPSRPIIVATPKHFAVHSGPESTRHTVDVQVSAHDIEDTYLPAFRAAIVEGHAGSIMCAYNSVNGQPACASDLLLTQRLIRNWGFKGYIVSDCDALKDINEGHHFAPDAASAVARAVKAGVSNECNTLTLFDIDGAPERYSEALKRGLLTPEDIDTALVKLFAARYRNGDLPGLPRVYADPKDQSQILSSEHQDLALRSAEEAMVLLQNDGQLPLKKAERLLVIGPLADATRVLRGNYSSTVSVPGVSVLSGLRQILPASQISYLPGPASVTDGDSVPRAALRTPDGKPGLLAEYFNPREPVPEKFASFPELGRQMHSLRFEETPILSRIEPGVAAHGQALSQVRGYHRTVWSGFLVPSESGSYRLALSATTGTLSFAGRQLAKLDDVPYGTPPAFTTVALKAGTRYPIRIETSASPLFDIQFLWKRIADPQQEDVRSAAAKVDAIVAVVGLTSDLEGEESKLNLPGFAGGDRTSLDLPSDQQRLLETAKASGKPLIVVVMNGSPINLSWSKQNAAAILEAWYPGQAGGLAVAKIISGQVNPGGRLPLTFYRNVSELPPFDDYSMQNRTYRYYTGKPVFPFGYGLSYTRFDYQNLKIDDAGDPGHTGIQLTLRVRNIGTRPGDDVSQLYLSFPKIPGAPQIALRGFQRVSLQPGEQKTIRFVLSPRDLSCVGLDGTRLVAAGEYSVFVGSGQPGTGVPGKSATFSTTSSGPLPL
jgi:beta-glucosidase